MTVQSHSYGGIYVPILVDASTAAKTLKEFQATAKGAATEISTSFKGALGSRAVENSLNNVNRALAKVEMTSKAMKGGMDDAIKSITAMGKAGGLAGKELDNYVRIQTKALDNKLVKEHERAVRDLNRATGDDSGYKKMTAGANAATLSVGSMVKQVGALAAAYVSLRGVTNFLGSGVSYNASVQDAGTGIAATLASTYNLIDAEGKLLKGREAYNAALRISEDIAKAVDAATYTASADYEKLLSTFQATQGPASRLKATWQENLQLITQMSNAMQVFGVDMQRLDKELLSWMTGKDFSNSQVARQMGLSKETVQQWRDTGQFINKATEALEQFGYAGERAAQGHTAVARDLKGTLESVAGYLTEELTDRLTRAKHELSRIFYDWDPTANSGAGGWKINQDLEALMDLGRDVATFLGEGVLGGVRTFNSAMETASGIVREFQGVFDAVGAVLRTVAGNLDVVVAGWVSYTAVQKTAKSAQEGWIASAKGGIDAWKAQITAGEQAKNAVLQLAEAEHKAAVSAQELAQGRLAAALADEQAFAGTRKRVCAAPGDGYRQAADALDRRRRRGQRGPGLSVHDHLWPAA